MNISTLLKDHSRLKQPILHNLLRRGEVGSISGQSKSRKSWLLLDLAIAVATGQPWHGKWETTKGKVLIADFELYPEVIADRLPQVAAARGVSLRDIDGMIDIECFRGRNLDIYGLKPFFRDIRQGEYSLAVIDPLYRAIPAGVSENDNSAVGRIFSQLDEFSVQIDAAILVAHHSGKGTQAGKSVTDVGSGAGSFARAVDCHIILRQHEIDDAVVMEAAIRSWPPIPASCYRWTTPVWNVDTELDPTKLKDALPYGHWKKREPYKRKTVKRSSTEIMELVTNLIPEGDNYVDSQDICFFAKDQDLSDRKVYRALNALVKRDMIECRRGKGPEPAVFRRKQAVKAKKGE
jgi:hypothetical protein